MAFLSSAEEARTVAQFLGEDYLYIFDNLVNAEHEHGARIYLLGAVDGAFERGEIGFDTAAQLYTKVGFSGEEAARVRASAEKLSEKIRYL